MSEMKTKIFLIIFAAILIVSCAPKAPPVLTDTALPMAAIIPASTGTAAITSGSTLALTPTKTIIPIFTEIVSADTAEPMNTVLPPLQPGQPIVLSSLHMIDANFGWGFESNGRIVRTHDGGITWNDITPSNGEYREGGFFALDADTAWATPACHQTCLEAPDFAIIWHTEDGGENWNANPPLCLNGDCGYIPDINVKFYYPRSLQFINAKTGWLLVVVEHVMMQDRYRLYQTSDGGVSWNYIIDNQKGPIAFITTGIAFTDEQNGWFGVSQVGGAEAPYPNWYVYKTIDGGNTWDKVDLPEPALLPEAFAQNPYWCGSAKVGITQPKIIDLTFYCDVYEENSRPRFFFHFHSYNGGENWQVWQETGGVSFINATQGLRLTARNNGLYNLEQTQDGGIDWVQIKTVHWAGSLDFINSQIGWAIATSGDVTTLVHTSDGGNKWAEIEPAVAIP
jgi:photosystem II stability/assembly factor-like uncharacterized protein